MNDWEIICADMCRACMKVDGVLLPMYDDDAIRRKNLPDKLAELASIQIDRFDGLPNMLCAKCAYRTDAFYDFKLQVQATERKLRKMFQTQTKPLVKMEVESSSRNEDDPLANNESIKLRILDHKDNDNIVNSIDQSEDLLPEVITINGNQTLEIDVSQLMQENGNDSKTDLRNILISKVQDLEVCQDREIKTELPDELSKLLESQHLDYTIMYIPESEIEALDENEDNLVCESQTIEGKHVLQIEDKTISDPKSRDEPIIETEMENGDENIDTACIPKEVKKEDECKKKSAGGQTLETVFFGNLQNCDEESQQETRKAPESDGSESDYFVDPQDNILGSLNDAVTRIKEIKLDGDVIQYQCTLCLQNYDKLLGVLLHTIDNHVPSTGPFFCVVCEKDCESHRELRSHVKIHTGHFPYCCFICNKAYTMKRYLKRHMVCHTDFPRYRCPKCGLRFKVKSEQETHTSTHIHGAPYACSQCPRVFNHKGNYKRHLITHLDPQGLHLPKYPCKVCGKRFLNNRTLETHMRVHTGEKPFKCHVCGRSFSQQGNLLNHVRIHSNPRSYTCEVCGKRFNQRATLRDHSLLHTGEKPYVCNVCGVAFTFSAALRRHMWTHTGGKPFGCEVCNARFVGKYDLRRHMRIHSDRPKANRKKNTVQIDESPVEIKDLQVPIAEDPNTETVLIEQVLLTQDVTQVVQQQESEKENVDALFNLIQYG